MAVDDTIRISVEAINAELRRRGVEVGDTAKVVADTIKISRLEIDAELQRRFAYHDSIASEILRVLGDSSEQSSYFASAWIWLISLSPFEAILLFAIPYIVFRRSDA
jgi:hypothetical protein